MLEVTVSDSVGCSRDAFWRLYFSEEFTQRWGAALGASELSIIDQHGSVSTGRLFRTARIRMPLNMPAPVRRLFGDEVEVEEKGTFKDGSWRFAVTPSRLADKVTATGVVSIDEDDVDSVRARCVLSGELNIRGIGRAVERLGQPEIHRLAKVSVACMKGYVEERAGSCLA